MWSAATLGALTCALENPPRIDARLAIGVGEACRVANEATSCDGLRARVFFQEISSMFDQFLVRLSQVSTLSETFHECHLEAPFEFLAPGASLQAALGSVPFPPH